MKLYPREENYCLKIAHKRKLQTAEDRIHSIALLLRIARAKIGKVTKNPCLFVCVAITQLFLSIIAYLIIFLLQMIHIF